MKKLASRVTPFGRMKSEVMSGSEARTMWKRVVVRVIAEIRVAWEEEDTIFRVCLFGVRVYGVCIYWGGW